MLVLKIAILVGALMVPPLKSDRPSLRQIVLTEQHTQKNADQKIDVEANMKRWKAQDMVHFFTSKVFFYEMYRHARCCQLEHEWAPVVGMSLNFDFGPFKFSLGKTWPWKKMVWKTPFDTAVWISRIGQTQVSWEHLLRIFILFWTDQSTPYSWDSRVIYFIECIWHRMDFLTRNNLTAYDIFHSMSRTLLKIHNEGFEAERKIMEHAVFCYQINGYKENEEFSWKETTWKDIRNAINCFKREVMAAGDQTIMIEFYTAFVTVHLPDILLGETAWNIMFYTITPPPLAMFPILAPCALHPHCWDYFMFNGIACPTNVFYRPQTIPGWFNEIRTGVTTIVDQFLTNGTFGKIVYGVKEIWADVKSDILNGKRRLVHRDGVHKDGYWVAEKVL